MRKKFLSALLFGAILVASTSTLTSCKDYDDDISGLQTEVTTNAQDLEALVNEKTSNLQAEITALKSAQSGLDKAYKEADEALATAIEKAQKSADDAEAKAITEAAAAQTAAVAAAQAMVNDALAALEAQQAKISSLGDLHASDVAKLVQADKDLTAALGVATADIEKAYALAVQVEKKANDNKGLIDANTEAIESVKNSLNTIKQTLEAQISVLDGKLLDMQTKVNKNAADILAQVAALNAYKTSMETVISELEGTNKTLATDIKTNLTSITKLQNDLANMETSVQGQQALWEAYANQAVAKVNESLGTLKEDQKTDVAAINAKIVDVNEGIIDLQKQINAISGGSGDLSTSLKTLESDIKAAQADITKLEGKIGTNNTNIAALQTALNTLESALGGDIANINADLDKFNAAHKSDLDKVNTELEKVNEAMALLATSASVTKNSENISALTTRVDELEQGYAAAVASLGEYSTMEEALKALNVNIANIISRLDNSVNVITASILNQLTGIIYQGMSTTNAPIIYYATVLGAKAGDKIKFPSVDGLPGASSDLIVGNINARKDMGALYISINPIDIDIAGTALNLINSEGTAHKYIALGGAENAKGVVLKTTNVRGVPVYLWRLPVQVKNNLTDKEFKELEGFSNDLYAVSHTFTSSIPQYDKDGLFTEFKDSTRTVLSKYAVNFTTKLATVQNSAEITAPGAISNNPGAYDFKFSSLKGTLTLTTNDNNGIYKSYLEIKDADGKLVTSGITGNYNQVLSGDNKSSIELTVDKSLVNKVFTVIWHVQGYNGATVSSEKTRVLFTDPLLDEETLNITVEAKQAGYLAVNTDFNKLAFINESAKNKIWTDNVKNVVITGAPASILFGFYSDKDYKNYVSPSSVKDAKFMTLSYAMSGLEFKTYNMALEYTDANGSVVNTLKVNLTINAPSLPTIEKTRMPLAFIGNKTIAWAQKSAVSGDAYFMLNASFNGLAEGYDKANSIYWFEEREASKVVAEQLKFVNAVNGYQVSIAVPADASKVLENKTFKLKEGVKFFGDTKKDANGNYLLARFFDESIELVFQSPIYHTKLVQADEDIPVIKYPGETKLENKLFTSQDPSKAGDYPVKFFSDRDTRISTVKVNYVGADNLKGLIDDIKTPLSQAFAKGDFTIHTTTHVVLQGDATLDFELEVVDEFGLTSKKPFKIKVTKDQD